MNKYDLINDYELIPVGHDDGRRRKEYFRSGKWINEYEKLNTIL